MMVVFLTAGVWWTGFYFEGANTRAAVAVYNTDSQNFQTDRTEAVSFLEEQKQWKDLHEEARGFVLGFVGDIMLDRGVEAKIIKHGGGDFGFPFELIRDELKNYDLLFGNLEGTISDRGTDTGSLYSFHMDVKAAPALKEAGFSVLSLANNHMSDWGKAALEDTLYRLKGQGILYSGGGFYDEDAYDPAVAILADGTSVAFVSFSQFHGYFEANEKKAGIAMLSSENVSRSIKKAKEMADIVIASFHYGDEYAKLPNDFQKKISRLAIDEGADLVVGHHPHVIQPVERYGDGWIAYSLGNFIFDQYFSEETMEGGFLEAIVWNGEIANVNLRKVKLNEHYQPAF